MKKILLLAIALLTMSMVGADGEKVCLQAELQGSDEVPPTSSQAAGWFHVTIEGSQLTGEGSFGGLAANFSGAHIHEAPEGTNGPVWLALDETLDSDNRGGELSGSTSDVTEEDKDEFEEEGYYVNVHSDDYPGGEIRGQLKKVDCEVPVPEFSPIALVALGIAVALFFAFRRN